MRLNWSNLPRWVLVLFHGVPFGIVMGAFVKTDGESWTSAVVGGLFMGVFYGLAMGIWAFKQQGETQAAGGDLLAVKATAAYRASARGLVPEGPEVRAAALRIATQDLARFRRPGMATVLVALALIWSVVGSVTASPWYLLPVAVFGFALFSQWYRPRRIRHRIELLSHAPNVHGGVPW
ncbi:hypothetical protein ACFPJ1_12240 [Kribbella qitaiheensis]|uniref:hypothetical protein n=1 Tax=Kribbella qitaiheensis TaxID=1544730 RepID=UPI00361C6804